VKARPVALAVAVVILGTPVLLFACAPGAIAALASRADDGCRYDVPVHGPDSMRIALTIDDAPDPATTPAILDTLRAHGAHATFFVITDQLRPGAGARDPIVSRLLSEGHEIGNHFTQDRPGIHLDSATFEQDLFHADSVLREYGPVHWARPGSGLFSARMVRSMRQAGYDCALGSVYPIDTAHPWPWLSSWYIRAHARPGAIIILHDRGERGLRTARVLGRVLPELRAAGYSIVTLSELSGPRASESRTSYGVPIMRGSHP
jgi:peptidoglycan/xylan/chitin deacetylase (PgdA/CDA1 family)